MWRNILCKLDECFNFPKMLNNWNLNNKTSIFLNVKAFQVDTILMPCSNWNAPWPLCSMELHRLWGYDSPGTNVFSMTVTDEKVLGIPLSDIMQTLRIPNFLSIGPIWRGKAVAQSGEAWIPVLSAEPSVPEPAYGTRKTDSVPTRGPSSSKGASVGCYFSVKK